MKPNGNYRFDVEPESHLDRSYRVVKKTDDKGEGDTSRERAVAVTAWSWLNRLAPSAGANVIKTDKMPINGDVYGHVLFSPTSSSTAFTEFTLGRNCTDLDVTFGLSDRTETGGKAVDVAEVGRRCRLRSGRSTSASPRPSSWTSPTSSGSASTWRRTTPRRTPSRRSARAASSATDSRLIGDQ